MSRFAGLCVAVLLTAAGCGVSGLSFQRDDRLSFVDPEHRSEVTLPVVVRWRIQDFDVGSAAGSFGVFVDRAPQPPGRPLSWFARSDKACAAMAGCPDDDYLADRDIYETTKTSFTVNALRKRDDRREFHELTIVLLDESGRRIGESAFTLEFKVEHS